MTAEERMAYFYGEKRRNDVNPKNNPEKPISTVWFKIRFIIAIILFIAFLSLDYTGYQIKGIGSEEIVREVVNDTNILQEKFGLSL